VFKDSPPTNSVTATGLSSGTRYQFYVQADCGTDISPWVSTFFATNIACPGGAIVELEVCSDSTNNACNNVLPVNQTSEPIAIGQTICGTSYYDGTLRDTDWYSFTLTQTRQVTLTGKADFDIQLYFVTSTCPGSIIASGAALAGNTASAVTTLAPGTYYAWVGPQFTGVFACGNDNQYYVTLTDGPPTIGCGNTNLGLITPTITSQNAAYTAGDTYYWTFNATAFATYTFNNCGAGEDTYLRIYNDAVTLVASNDDNGIYCSGAEASLDFIPTVSGLYYVSLAHYSCIPLDNAGNLAYYYTPAPACPTPLALNVTNITNTSASLGWTSSATAWEYQVGLSGFTPAPTGIATSANPTNITGLVSGTAYQFYVRANCDGTFSDWAGPYAFTTQLVVPVPYSEGFITTSIPAGWNTSGWIIGSIRGATGNPGNNIYKNLWSSAPTGTFTTVNVGPISTGMFLTFDYKLSDYNSPYSPPAVGSGNYVLSVSTDFGTTYSTLETVTNNGVAGWQSKQYDMTAYAGLNVKIRIVGNWISGDYDLAFDNFYIGTPPTCFVPTDVAVSDITQTTATISWTAASPAPANGYQWEVRNASEVVISSGSTAAGVTTADATNLVASTPYKAYVRSVCSEGNYSAWAGPASFNTACEAQELPYTENFDGVTAPAIPLCMSVTDDNGDAVQWVTSTSSPMSAPNAMRIGFNSSLAMDDWFFSPALNLVPGTYNVSFWYRSSGVTYPEALEVKWGAAPNAAGMTSAAIFDNNNIINTAYQEGTGVIIITSPGTYYVGWHGYSDADMWYLLVDDISITVPPAFKTLNLTSVLPEGLYAGGGTLNQAKNDVGDPQFPGYADEITVELHDGAAYGTILHTATVLLSTTGAASVIDIPAALNGNYWITVKHRNSVQTVSATAVSFASDVVNQSFGSPADVYGGNLQLMSDSGYAIFGGDVTQDGVVDTDDMTEVDNDSADYVAGYVPSDVTGDGAPIQRI
jgi:hypothetical protein